MCIGAGIGAAMRQQNRTQNGLIAMLDYQTDALAIRWPIRWRNACPRETTCV